MADSVHVQRKQNGLICIHNHRYDRQGDDCGGILVLDSTSMGWLRSAIRDFVADRRPRQRKFENDDLRVKFGGPDYHPRVAIFNRRRAESIEGGTYAQSVQMDVVPSLLEQLDKGGTPHPEPAGLSEIRLSPGIPTDVGGCMVAMGSAAPGPYRLSDGTEGYGRAATVVVLNDGSEQEVGVGGVLHLSEQRWAAASFEEDGTLCLKLADERDSITTPPQDPNPLVYPNADMANLWVQSELPFATWRVDLRPAVHRSRSDFEQFVAAIIDSGERTEVLRVLRVDSLGYDREEHGPLLPFVRHLWERQAGPDVFGPMEGVIIESQIAWFDGTGRLFENPVRHLELILEMDEPYVGAVDGFREPMPPVRIFGPTWEKIQWAAQREQSPLVELEIALHSDIWFPWISGMAHPLADHRRQFDNRVLAHRHSPRLNAFLENVAAAAEWLGAKLVLDRDETRVRPEFIHDKGVVLDGPPPPLQMTEADRNVSWLDVGLP